MLFRSNVHINSVFLSVSPCGCVPRGSGAYHLITDRGVPEGGAIITLHGQGVPPISTLMLCDADATVELVQCVYHFAHHAFGDSFETLGFEFV